MLQQVIFPTFFTIFILLYLISALIVFVDFYFSWNVGCSVCR